MEKKLEREHPRRRNTECKSTDLGLAAFTRLRQRKKEGGGGTLNREWKFGRLKVNVEPNNLVIGNGNKL